MWSGAFIYGVVVALPALAFAWGAVTARVDVERGRARVYGFGRTDPSGPKLDSRSGLRWRSLGCSVDPISELWSGGYNLVARRAAQRGECDALTRGLRTIEDAERAFSRGGAGLEVGSRVELSGEVVVEVEDDGTVVTRRDSRTARIWPFNPHAGALSMAMDQAGEIVYLRVVIKDGSHCDGVASDWVRYTSIDASTGEWLQWELSP